MIRFAPLLSSVLLIACAEPPPVRFADVTAEAGLLRETPTYDAVVADFDGDDALDLYVGNHAAGAVLLRNRGDGTFADVLPESGIAPDGDQHGAGAADYDRDGDLDLYVSVGAGRGTIEKSNRLYRNDGAGRFTEEATRADLTDPKGRSRGVAWLDYDRDGAPDLLIANYASPIRLFRNRSDGTFADVTEAVGLSGDGHHVAWSDIDADSFPDVAIATSDGLALFRNDGGLRFVDVTASAGLRSARSTSTVAFGDFDGDGAVDLYAGAGAAFQESVVEKEGELRFAFFAGDEPKGFDFVASADEPSFALFHNGLPVQAEAVRCGSATASTTTATSAKGDARLLRCPADASASDSLPEGDGFAIWRDGEDESLWHLRWSGAGDHHLSGVVHGAEEPTEVGLKSRTPGGGTVLRNDGRGSFHPVDVPALEDGVNALAATWADVDNDGWLDLYVVDGGVEGDGGRNRLYLNVAGRELVPAVDETGASPARDAVRGAAAHFFDYDRDGDLDLLLLDGAGVPPFDKGPYHLLRNDSVRRHFLSLELVGRSSDRRGLGARVEVEACGRRQRIFHTGGEGPTSQSVAPLHVGLGECTSPARVSIDWPSGVHQSLGSVEIDRTVRIEEPPQDVILIVIDTQRSQNMSLYGYGRQTSPELEELARDAVTYERAVSPSTWTVPSHGSLLTGRWPSYHGAERVAGDKLQAMPIDPDIPTLAELMRSAGYRTAAIVANYTYVSPIFGFHRGFEIFDYEAKFLRAEDILAKAEKWLAAQTEPAFLFVNVIDPHEPYEPPPPYDGMYPGKDADFGRSFRELLHVQHRTVTPEMRDHFVSQYDGETTYTDHALGHFLERLRTLGRYRNSLVIVTSDHGELIGEHDLAGHGLWPWEEQVRVPLLVKYPGSRDGGRRVATRVSNLGVFAAALRAAGINAPEGVAPDPFDESRPVFVEDLDFNGHRVRAVYEGSRKLISSVDPAGNEWTSLYDLETDPEERRPLDLEVDASRLRKTLADFRSLPRPTNQAKRPIIDAERERKLRELGYVR